MSKQHSELGASSAHRWLNCPGSVRLSRGLRSGTSVASEEGTRAHALLEQALKGDPAWWENAVVTDRGPELVVPSEEMVDAVGVAVSVVKSFLREDVNYQLYVERGIDLAPLNPPSPMFGTADVVMWLPEGSQLVVLDFKYGLQPVEVKDNPQLLYYALGAMLALLPGAVPETITLVVVQPRAEHPDGYVRRVDLSFDDLLAFSEDLLLGARKAMEPDAPLVVGSWCRWCKAMAVCPAQAARTQLVAQTSFEISPTAAPPAPETLPRDVFERALAAAEMLKQWAESVQAHGQRLLEQGETLPGWKLVQKRANRVWVDAAAVVDLATGLGFERAELVPEKLKAPAQLEKLLGKKNVPQNLYDKPTGRLEMVPEYDSRSAIAPGTEFTCLPNLGEADE